MAGNGKGDLRQSYWLYRLLPPKAAAFAQLARLDRPIGWRLLFWPCIWGLLLGLWQQKLRLSFGAPWPVPQAEFGFAALAHYHAFSALGFFVWAAALFLLGAVAMRGAGCTYNDIVDYKIDAQVARTQSRPLPSGRVSRKEGFAFIGAQCLVGLAVLLQFPRFVVILALCPLALVALYPFMKRVTDWPQLVLGLCFNWGALVGYAAVCDTLSLPALLLYGGAVCWTIGYDTIYAHQDREYDALIGMRSTALLFGRKSRLAVSVFYILAFCGFFAAFWLAGAGISALLGVVLAGACLGWQIWQFDLDNPLLCLRLFQSNNWAGLWLALPAALGLLF